jgi:hypothetical protein
MAALAAHLPKPHWGDGGVLHWLMGKFAGKGHPRINTGQHVASGTVPT